MDTKWFKIVFVNVQALTEDKMRIKKTNFIHIWITYRVIYRRVIFKLF